MSEVRCEIVADGLRDSEALVTIRDYQGKRHWIRVERDFLSREGGAEFLPIGIVHTDANTKAVPGCCGATSISQSNPSHLLTMGFRH